MNGIAWVPNQYPHYNICTESQLVQVRLRVTPPDASKAFSLPDYQWINLVSQTLTTIVAAS